jgi:DNA polymerase-3 subunit beta
VADEFPALPDPDETVALTLARDEFRDAVNTTAIVASSDTTRPILTGVYLHTEDGELYFAATDGYRLAEKRVAKCDQTISAIVPAATLTEVTRVISDDLNEIKLGFSEDQVTFYLDDIIITSRLVDGQFINYRQLIPTKTEVSAEVERAELTRAVKVSELFARASAGSIALNANSAEHSLTIHSIASEFGENTVTADAEVTGNGEITLNSKFLRDALNCLNGEMVAFQFSGKLAPALLTAVGDDSYKHIIMPVKS